MLADMEKTWAASVVSFAEPCARKALLRTCTLLRDAVLSSQAIQVKVTVDLTTEGAVSGLNTAALTLADQAWCLHLEAYAPEQATQVLFSQQLHTLKHLTIQGGCLPCILPPSTQQACPNLEHLTLSNCSILSQQPDVDVDVSCPPALQHLVLNHVRIQAGSSSAAPDLGPQFSALVNLVSVEVPDHWSAWQDHISAVGTHLTRLSCSRDVPNLGGPSSFALRFCSLQALHLDNLQVSDRRMRILLGMSQLHSLRVDSFHLRDSYTSRGCSWQQVSVAAVEVRSLSRLPLHSLTSLTVRGSKPELWLADSGDDPEVEVALTDACTRQFLSWGSLSWSAEVEAVQVAGIPADEQADATPAEDLFIASLPLLQTFTGILSFGVWFHVTEALLVSMHHHLSPALQGMEFVQCLFDAAAKAQLVHRLPAGVHQLLLCWLKHQACSWSFTDLRRICMEAEQQLVIQMKVADNSLPEGWLPQLQTELADAGRTHVQLTR